MANLKALYQEVILDHNKKPRNYGAVEQASHHAEGHNPLCGDHLSITLAIADENIQNIAFNGESCAICKASASMMTVAVKGKSRADAEILIEEFLAMVTGKLDLNIPDQKEKLAHIGRLAVFAGVHDLPTRVKCAILPWHTLHAAFTSVPHGDNVERVSTEADNDPMHLPVGNA